MATHQLLSASSVWRRDPRPPAPALALLRPWGRVNPRGWLQAGSAGTSALLVAYGGLNALLGALVLLSDVIHPAGSVDRTALRWHVGVSDPWFLV